MDASSRAGLRTRGRDCARCSRGRVARIVDAESLIRRYYDAFNSRRFGEAQGLLASDASIEHLAIDRRSGSDAYLSFAHRWLDAFPDGRIEILAIHNVGTNWYEVSLVGEGTHEGNLDMGALGVLRTTHRHARLPFRHLVEVRDGRITSSTLSFDTQELVRQLAS